MTNTKPEIEVRHAPNGSIDEILLYRDGECLVHLEYMDSGLVWMGLYGKEKMAHVRLGAKSRIQTTVDISDNVSQKDV